MSVLQGGTEVEFDRAPAEVFEAMVRALPEARMKLKSSDAATHHIEATTGMSLASWGENIRIDLSEAAPGRTRATISSANKAQLVSWGKNKKNLDKIVEKTRAQLGL